MVDDKAGAHENFNISTPEMAQKLQQAQKEIEEAETTRAQQATTIRNKAGVTSSRAGAMGTTRGVQVATKHCRKLGREAREQEGKQHSAPPLSLLT